MPLPEEEPFTDEEVAEIEQLVRSVLLPIHAFTRQATAAVIPPDVFLLVPAHQERLSELIDHFMAISDLLPPDYAARTHWDLLECRDRLLAIEGFGTLAGQIQPLFGNLDLEIGPHGHPRLALPQDFIQLMITEGDLTNVQIAELLGAGSKSPLINSILINSA